MKDISEIREYAEKLEVLSEIYHDMESNAYPSKKERDLAKLKMELIKKEMLLMTYKLNKGIDAIKP